MINKTYDQISNNDSKYLPTSNHHLDHIESAFKMFIDKPIIGVYTNLVYRTWYEQLAGVSALMEETKERRKIKV